MGSKHLIIAILALAYAQTSLAGRIHDLAQRGEFGAFRAWLDEHPSELESLNEISSTPLLMAAREDRLEVARLLLDRGANPNAANGGGRTPLYWAAWHGRLEIARLLLDRGANVNAADMVGETPLHSAANSGHLELARLLLDRRAKVNAADWKGITPLHEAAWGVGRLEMARLLLDRGANPNGADRDGKTPLYWAAVYGHLEVARLLLDRGANPNVAERDGRTPLHVAAVNGHLEMVRLLLDRGANPNAADREGYTPLYQSANRGRLNLLRELVARGALVTDRVRAAAPDEATRALLSPEGIARIHWEAAEGYAAAGRHTAAARSFALAGNPMAAADSYQAAGLHAAAARHFTAGGAPGHAAVSYTKAAAQAVESPTTRREHFGQMVVSLKRRMSEITSTPMKAADAALHAHNMLSEVEVDFNQTLAKTTTELESQMVHNDEQIEQLDGKLGIETDPSQKHALEKVREDLIAAQHILAQDRELLGSAEADVLAAIATARAALRVPQD